MRANIEGSASNLMEVWDYATNWERADGGNYYATQRLSLDRIADDYKMSLLNIVGAFAALSPNNDEAGNYRDLKACCQWINKHVYLGPNSVTKKDLPMPAVSTYPANRNKALRILGGCFPDEVLGGLKVKAFYHNTIDPTDPYWVTVDGHMVSAWHGKKLLLRRSDDDRGSAVISKGQYHVIASDVRMAAKRVKVLPCQFQSTVWLTWKRLHKIRYDAQLKIDLSGLETNVNL